MEPYILFALLVVGPVEVEPLHGRESHLVGRVHITWKL